MTVRLWLWPDCGHRMTNAIKRPVPHNVRVAVERAVKAQSACIYLWACMKALSRAFIRD